MISKDSPISPNFPCRVFVFSIGKFQRENVYENTRKYWKITQRYQDTSLYGYAVGVINGYSESAYRLSGWNPTRNMEYEGKYEFDGEEFLTFEGFSWNKQIKKAGGFWNWGGHLVVEFDGNGKFRLERPNRPDWTYC